jgi:hypothetical protein
VSVADIDAVQAGVEHLVELVDGIDPATAAKIPDASVSALLVDLDVAYGCRFESGRLLDVRSIDPGEVGSATLRLTMTSQVFLDLVEGRLHFGQGWATGKVRVDASFRDLLKLRSFL